MPVLRQSVKRAILQTNLELALNRGISQAEKFPFRFSVLFPLPSVQNPIIVVICTYVIFISASCIGIRKGAYTAFQPLKLGG